MKASPVPSLWHRAALIQYRSNLLAFAQTSITPSHRSAGEGHYPLPYLALDWSTVPLEY